VTRFLTIGEIVTLHRAIVADTGGATGIRDLGGLESAAAQPRATFGGEELHPTLFAKAAALGYSLALNHPFVDGNKRVAHAAMEIFLVLNGIEIDASVDEQETLMLDVAAGRSSRATLEQWLATHCRPIQG
jgi:death-on-curing protein